MPVSDHEEELAELKTSLQDTQPVGSLVNCCRLVPARNSDADVVLSNIHTSGPGNPFPLF